jgi:hypothetical protein
MLLRTLFVLVFLMAIAETIVHGAHALAGALLGRQASIALQTSLADAVATAQETVAGAIEAGGDPRALSPVAPSPAPTCVLQTQKTCGLFGETSIAFQPPAATASPCPSAACAAYAQGNDAVDEGRIDAVITVQIVTSNGAVLASRSGRAAFRTLLVAPYAVAAGNGDDSLASVANAGTGDDAGTVPLRTAPGTLIDVLYQNRVTGQTMPANVWNPQAPGSSAAAPAWAP